MRALLWILLFLTLSAAVALYLSRVTNDARAERSTVRGAHEQPDEPEGFGHAFVGEKSGAPLVEPDPRSAPPVPRVPSRAGNEPERGSQSEHVVERGESLSTICSRYYGSSGPAIVAALARFNGLANVDAIRVGQKILIPPIGTLGLPAK